MRIKKPSQPLKETVIATSKSTVYACALDHDDPGHVNWSRLSNKQIMTVFNHFRGNSGIGSFSTTMSCSGNSGTEWPRSRATLIILLLSRTSSAILA